MRNIGFTSVRYKCPVISYDLCYCVRLIGKNFTCLKFLIKFING
jgi:hypothetical protein